MSMPCNACLATYQGSLLSMQDHLHTLGLRKRCHQCMPQGQMLPIYPEVDPQIRITEQGDSIPPCLTPCLMQKGWDFWPSQMTELVAELYQLLMRCHRCPLALFYWSFTKRPLCQTVSKALQTSRKATQAFFPLSLWDCTASCSTKAECAQQRPSLKPPCRGLSEGEWLQR